MKKFTMTLLLLGAAAQLRAEGYQVNVLSARQTGMGHTGTGMKLGSESIHFNPAALAFQSASLDFSLGMGGIISKVDFVNETARATSDNKLSTPLYGYLSYKPTPRLAVGVGLTTPYGSSMNWGDDWVGAHLIQQINLKAFVVQPTLSYRLFDKVSIGVGAMIAFGSFDLSRSMLPVGKGSEMISTQLAQAAAKYTEASRYYASQGQSAQAAAYAEMADQATSGSAYIGAITDSPLVSATLSGSSDVAVGINAGIMYDINERWTLGLSYRSKMVMKVAKGSAELNYRDQRVHAILGMVNQASVAAGGVPVIPELNRGTFHTQLPLPSNTTLGVSFRPTPMWEFALDFQFVGWHAYQNLCVSFNEPELEFEDIDSRKNYKNTLITRVGARCQATAWLTVRAGFYLDQSPVRSFYLNPETPSMTKAAYSVGASLMPSKKISLDLAYVYITSADPERTGSYPYSIAGVEMPFSGNYTINAHTFSVGCSMRF